MKLYNHTPLPDATLENLLALAGRSVGARTSGVIVEVKCARREGLMRGKATECVAAKVGPARGTKRWVDTDGGKFEVFISTNHHNDPLAIAERFLNIARHEWSHVADYQAGGRRVLKWSRATNGRRPPHDSRPEEVRAENHVFDSDQKLRSRPGYFTEAVLALALAIEEIRMG